MHLPKTKETAGLLGADALAKTKPGVIIVNAARGGLIDEQALADAIRSGHVRAAGWTCSPPSRAPTARCSELPEVVVTRIWAPRRAKPRTVPAPTLRPASNSPLPVSSCRTPSTSQAAP